MTVQLIHGDCLDVLKTLDAGSVDAVVTDPPYPGLKGGLTHSSPHVTATALPTTTVGELWGGNLESLSEFRRVARYGAIVFCSWHSIGRVRELLGGEAVGLVTWHKRNSQHSFRNRPHYTCEYAWLIEYAPGMNWKVVKTLYDIPGLAAGCFASERVLMPDSKRAAHPTQKPVELMTALIQSAGATILDPFMGSGTTGVAAVKTGRNFIGIEISEEYYNVAEKRIREAQAQLPIPFDPTYEADGNSRKEVQYYQDSLPSL